jgi:hypothetical protein
MRWPSHVRDGSSSWLGTWIMGKSMPGRHKAELAAELYQDRGEGRALEIYTKEHFSRFSFLSIHNHSSTYHPSIKNIPIIRHEQRKSTLLHQHADRVRRKGSIVRSSREWERTLPSCEYPAYLTSQVLC